MKCAANCPVTTTKNMTPFLCLTQELLCPVCQKHALNKLQPKPKLVQTYTYKVNDADGKSLAPIRMTTCTFEFPMKFQQQFILCKHLFQPVILGLDLSCYSLIRTNWFSANQLHLHQGPRSMHNIRPCTIFHYMSTKYLHYHHWTY